MSQNDSSWILLGWSPVRWEEISSCPAQSLGPGPEIRVDSIFGKDSGIQFSGNALFLYCRDGVRQQFEFLRNEIVGSGAMGYILGPPGTGKSSTTLAFLSTLDRTDWVITWIHLRRKWSPMCMQFHGEHKYSISGASENEIQNILQENFESIFGVKQKRIVILDGYVEGENDHEWASKVCHKWLEKSRQYHRLVIVCSTSSRGKNTVVEDRANNVKNHNVYSWSKDDCKAALKIKSIYEQAAPFLDAHIEIDQCEPDIEEMAESKFHFSGGSCRYFFCFTTAEIISQIEESVRRAHKAVEYLTCEIGDQSDQVVNRLYSRYLNDESRPTSSIISRYAAALLAIIQGPDLVDRLCSALQGELNLSVEGWLFEMRFFSKLKRGGIRCEERLSQGGRRRIEWSEVGRLLPLDPINPVPFSGDDAWMKPVKWNQGGYDAVFFSKKTRNLRFVKITRAAAHSLKLEFFASLLGRLKVVKGYRVQSIEICYIIPKQSTSFRITPISGLGLLSAYKVGPGASSAGHWECGKEHGLVQILQMEDIHC